MIQYFDKKRKVLLFFHKRLNKNYWDNLWIKNWDKLKRYIYNFNPNSIICNITRSFLHPNDGPIIEGGCGLGKFVYSLSCMNYKVVGIDNAKFTIEKINKFKPELNIKFGDVQNIQFPDNYFAGYWSLGVIEHFFNGYYQILLEAKRIIKPSGYLFITFPYMSPFRKFKARTNFYKIFNPKFYNKHKSLKNFYQYALNKEQLIDDLKELGFNLRHMEPKGGIKGFKGEVFFLKFFIKNFLQLLYKSQNSKYLNSIIVILEGFLVKFSGNTILLVFQKEANSHS